ncbi:hypothetical protein J6590_022963 [Homalodisca vitripennis]|nr:hypothetical protein J6590_022963 [Homalodisca vitripennis]
MVKELGVDLSFSVGWDIQAEFSSYEQFLIHKMLWEQYKLVLREAERIPGLRLPDLMRSKPRHNCSENNGFHLPALGAFLPEWCDTPTNLADSAHSCMFTAT